MRWVVSLLLLCAVPALASPSSASADEARRLVRSARGAFNEGRFDEAATLLEKAQALAPAPAILYNLGRAYERAGRLQPAIAAYRNYLLSADNLEDRGATEAAIADLQQRLEEQQRLGKAPSLVATTPPPAAPPSPTSAHSHSAGPWILGGVGVAGMGVAIGLGLSAQSTQKRAQAETAIVPALADQKRAEQLAVGANVSYAAGGAVVAGALVWLIVDRVVTAKSSKGSAHAF